MKKYLFFITLCLLVKYSYAEYIDVIQDASYLYGVLNQAYAGKDKFYPPDYICARGWYSVQGIPPERYTLRSLSGAYCKHPIFGGIAYFLCMNNEKNKADFAVSDCFKKLPQIGPVSNLASILADRLKILIKHPLCKSEAFRIAIENANKELEKQQKELIPKCEPKSFTPNW